jgi:hypothetical protein
MNVIENIIPTDLQNHIESYLLGNTFPLYLNTKTVNIDNQSGFQDKLTKDGLILNHYFIREGQLVSQNAWDFVKPIAIEFIKKIGIPPKISSCKLNITFADLNHSFPYYFPPHYDTPDRAIVAIYYVNNSDGDTILFKNQTENGCYIIEKLISPTKGSMVYFNQATLHSNYSPRNTSLRCVINFNFLLDY